MNNVFSPFELDLERCARARRSLHVQQHVCLIGGSAMKHCSGVAVVVAVAQLCATNRRARIFTYRRARNRAATWWCAYSGSCCWRRRGQLQRRRGRGAQCTMAKATRIACTRRPPKNKNRAKTLLNVSRVCERTRARTLARVCVCV